MEDTHTLTFPTTIHQKGQKKEEKIVRTEKQVENRQGNEMKYRHTEECSAKTKLGKKRRLGWAVEEKK